MLCKQSSWKLVSLLAIGLTVLASFGCERSRAGLNPGDRAPELELTDLKTDQKRTLSSFFGKKILLNFWASWCTPCAEEIPLLNKLYARLKDRDFLVVGIALEDNRKDLDAFLKKYPVSFPVLFDEAGLARKKFKLGGFPESFVLNSSGELQMVIDPRDGGPVVKLIGPRNWASENFIRQLEAIK